MTLVGRIGGRPSVAFLCPGCRRENVRTIGEAVTGGACPGCGRAYTLHAGGHAATSAALARCVCCGLDRLYVQKDFSKKAGLCVFLVAAALSVPTWGLSLLAATIIDLVLYYALGDAILCYGCGAVHRGFGSNPAHGPFDIHTQEAVDRLARTA